MKLHSSRTSSAPVLFRCATLFTLLFALSIVARPANAQTASGFAPAPLIGKETRQQLTRKWIAYLRANVKAPVQSAAAATTGRSADVLTGLGATADAAPMDAPSPVGASSVSSLEQSVDITLGAYTLSQTTGLPTSATPTNTDVTWSHDNSFLVFASNAVTTINVNGHYHLYVMSSSGGPIAYNGTTPIYIEQLTGLTPATANYDERYPSLLGPNDANICYCSTNNANSVPQLVTASLTTAGSYSIGAAAVVNLTAGLEARHPYYTSGEILFSGRPINAPTDSWNIWIVTPNALSELTGPTSGLPGLDEDYPSISSTGLVVWDSTATGYTYSGTGTPLTASGLNGAFHNIWTSSGSGVDAFELTDATTYDNEHPVWTTDAGTNAFVGGVNASEDIFFDSSRPSPLPAGNTGTGNSIYYYPAFSNLSAGSSLPAYSSAGVDEIQVTAFANYPVGDNVILDQGNANQEIFAVTGQATIAGNQYLVLGGDTAYNHFPGESIQLDGATAVLQTETQANATVEVDTSNPSHTYSDTQPVVSTLTTPYIEVAYISNRYLINHINDNPLSVSSLTNSTLASDAVAAGATDVEPTSSATNPTTGSEIMISQLIDFTTPSLVTFNQGNSDPDNSVTDNAEIVHVFPGDVGAYVAPTPTSSTTHLVPAGSDATFVVRLSDRQVGLGQAWLQIKDPESAYQDTTGLEHKVFTRENNQFFHSDLNEATELFNQPAQAGYNGNNDYILLGNQAIYTTGLNAAQSEEYADTGSTVNGSNPPVGAGTNTMPVTNAGVFFNGEEVVIDPGQGNAEVVGITGTNTGSNPQTISLTSNTVETHNNGEPIAQITNATTLTSNLNGETYSIPVENSGAFKVGDIVGFYAPTTTTTGTNVTPRLNTVKPVDEMEVTSIPNGTTIVVDKAILLNPPTKTILTGVSGYGQGEILERYGQTQFDPAGQEVDCQAIDTSLVANTGSPLTDAVSDNAADFYVPKYTPSVDDNGPFINMPTDTFGATTTAQAILAGATSVEVASLTTFTASTGQQVVLGPGQADAEVVTLTGVIASPPTLQFAATKFAHGLGEAVANYNDSYWLALKPLPAADQDGNGGTLYYATWNTPLDPSDYYVDVVAEDASKGANWKIYDNIWGFTTQPFQANNTILVVNDYALPQKFFNRGNAADTNNGPNHIYGTESYWTDLNANIDDWENFYNNLPEDLDTPQVRTSETPAVLPMVGEEINYTNGNLVQRAKLAYSFTGGDFTSAPFFPAYGNGLGVNAYVDGQMNNESQISVGGAVTDTLPNSNKYDIWRILSRGPIPLTTLESYGGQTQVQPPYPLAANPAPISTFVAKGCVIWLSPYSGDVYAGPGTITDNAAQTNLDSFLQNGGRLHIEGKDIGYALTQDGTIDNSFYNTDLNNYPAGGAAQAFLTDDVGAGNGSYVLTGATGVANSISTDAFVDGTLHSNFFYPIGDGVSGYGAPSSHKLTIGHYFNETDTNSRSDASLDCDSENSSNNGTYVTSYIDGFSTDALSELTGTTNQEVFYRNAAAAGTPYFGSIVSYSSFGIATISQEIQNATATAGDPGNNYFSFNQRTNIIHNIVCTMRTGTMSGYVTTSGASSVAVGDAVVSATDANGSPIYPNAVYTAITNSAGLYTLEGLPPGNYTISAYKEGYSFQHAGSSERVHGGDSASLSVTLTAAGAGALKVVVEDSNGNPLAVNATVTPSEVEGGTAPGPISAPTTPPNIYLFSSIATGIYSVTATAPNYQPTTVNDVSITQGSTTTVVIELPEAVPAAPTNLTATGGNAQITLNWTASPLATSYNVYRGTTPGGENPTPIATMVAVSPAATTYVDMNVTNGTTYYYYVAGVDTTGVGPASNEASATAQVPIAAAPTNLTATAGNQIVNLNWTASAGAASYNVYRGTTPGGESATPINAQPVTATNYMDTGLNNGTTYYYTVAAVNAAGTSQYSNEASATPLLPTAPTNLTAAPGNQLVTLNWAASAGDTTFNVYRGTTPGGENPVPINTTPVTGTTYTDSGLVNGTTYYYTVTGVSSGAISPPSNEASATPQVPAPAAPTNLTATGANTTISLNWTGSATATGYYIYRGTSAGAESPTPLNSTPQTGTTYTDTALTNGTTYYYIVKAVNPGGTGPASNEASATPQAPAVPTNLAAVGGNGVVNLTWTASTGASSYNVFRGTTSSGESSTPIATNVTTTSYSDTAVVNGDTYYYYVEAVVPGLGTSAPSNQASATPQVPPPAAPTQLTAATQPGVASIALNWTASTGAVSYNLYRGTVAGGEGATPYKTGLTTTSFTDVAVNVGTQYFYTVAAVDAGGTSMPSNEASATTTLPAAPTALKATAGSGVVSLTWTASVGAASYNVYRGTSPGGEATVPLATDQTVTTYTDTSVINGTTYYYTVVSVAPDGTSSPSNEAAATPQIAPPIAPTGLTATPGNATVSLSWTASSGATSYNIYRGTATGGESSTPLYTGITGTTQTDSNVSNGTTYYYTVEAVNSAGISGPSNEASATPEGILHPFSAGLVMIGAPVNDTGYSLGQEFDQTMRLAVWNPTTSSYALNPTAPANTVVAGQGYWARFITLTDLLNLGTTVSATQPVSVSLSTGWNMIGVPRSTTVPASDMLIEYFGASGGTSYSFAQACANGLVANTMYTYQAGDTAYEAISGADGNLQPYEGYWIYAYQPCTFYFAAQ